MRGSVTRAAFLWALAVVATNALDQEAPSVVPLGDTEVSLGENDTGDVPVTLEEINSLKQQLVDATAVVDKLKVRNNGVGDQVTSMQASADGWSHETERSAAAKSKAEAEVEKLEGKIENTRSNIKDRLANMQQDVNTEVEARDAKLKSHDKDMEDKEAELEKKIKDMDSEAEEKDELMSDTLEKIQTNKQKIDATDAQTEKLQKLEEEGKMVEAHLKESSKEKASELESKAKMIQGRSAKAEEEIDYLQGNFTSLDALPASIRDKSEMIHNEYVSAKGVLDSVKKQVHQLKDATTTAEGQLEEYDAKAKVLASEKSAAEKGLADAKATNAEIMDKIRNDKAAVDTIKGESDASEAEANRLYDEAAGIVQSSKHLEEKINKAEEAKKKWTKVGDLAATSVEKLHSMKESVRAKTNALEADIIRLTTKSDEVQEEFSTAKRKLQERLRDLKAAEARSEAAKTAAHGEQKTLTAEIQKHDDDAAKAAKEAAQLDKKLAKLKVEGKFLKESLAKRREENAQAVGDFNALSKKLKVQMTTAKTKIGSMGVEDEQAQKELKHTAREHQKVVATIKRAHEKELSKLEDASTAAKKKKIKAEKEAQLVVQVAVAKQKKVIALGRQAQATLEKKEAQLSKKLTTKKHTITDMVAAEQSKMEKRKKKIEDEKEQLDNVTTDETQLEAKIAADSKRVTTLQSKLVMVKDKAGESVKYKETEAQEIIKQKEAKLELAKLQIDKHQHIIRLLQDKLSGEGKNKAGLEAQVQQSKSRVASLQDMIDEEAPKLQKEKDDLAAAADADKKLQKAEGNFETKVSSQQNALLSEEEAIAKAESSAKAEEEAVTAKQGLAEHVAETLGKLQAQVDSLEAHARTKEAKILRESEQRDALKEQNDQEESQLTEEEKRLRAQKEVLAGARETAIEFGQEADKDQTTEEMDAAQLKAIEGKLSSAESMVNEQDAKLDGERDSLDEEKYKDQEALDKEARLKGDMDRLDGKLNEAEAKAAKETKAAEEAAKAAANLQSKLSTEQIAESQKEADAMRKQEELAADTAVKKELQRKLDGTNSGIDALKARIALEKQKLADEGKELSGEQTTLSETTQKDQAAKTEAEAALTSANGELKDVTQKLNDLEAESPQLESSVSDLKLQNSALQNKIESASEQAEGAKDKTQELEAEKSGLDDQLKSGQHKVDAESESAAHTALKLAHAQKEEERLQQELLSLQLSARSDSDQLASAKNDLAETKSDINTLNSEADAAKSEVGSTQASADGDKAALDAAKSRTERAADSPQLQLEKDKLAGLKAKDKEDEERTAQAASDTAAAKRAKAVLHGKLIAVDARVDHVKQSIHDAKEEILDAKHDQEHQGKRAEVLTKVKEQWSDALTTSSEAVESVQAEHQRTTDALDATTETQSAAVEREKETLAAVEKKADEWESMMHNVTDTFNTADLKNKKVKADEASVADRSQMLDAQLTHYTKRLAQLRERKRALVQSKLDDLEQQTAPFHEEALNAMDQMAKANQLRADAMQQSLAVVEGTPAVPGEEEETTADEAPDLGPDSAISNGDDPAQTATP